MPTAFNEKTGELLVLGDDGGWTKPTTAKNPQTGETLYHDGAEWKPIPITAEQRYVGQTAAIADMGLGIGDEFLAGVGSVFDPASGDYSKQLTSIREAQKKYGESDMRGQLARNVVGSLPLAVATGAGVSNAVGRALPTLGRVGNAAVTGALYGGAAGFGSGEGGIANRTMSAGLGAGLGATIESVASPLVSRMAQYLKSSPALVDEAGNLTPRGSRYVAEYATRVGSDPAEMSASLQKELATQAQQAAKGGRAVNPQQAAALAEANTLPIKVPMTQGQLNQNPELQLFESEAAKGRYGPSAQDSIARVYSQAQDALDANAEAIRQRIIGSTRQSEPGDRGQAIQSALATLRGDAKTAVNDLYTAARQGGDAAIDPNAYRQGVQNVINDVAESFDQTSAPKTSAILSNLAKSAEVGDGNASQLISNVFRVRRQLTSLGADIGADGAAAGTAKRALDKHLIDMMDEAAMSGDAGAIDRWKAAIKSFREYATKYQGKDLIQTLTDKVKGANQLKVDSVDAMNVILGRDDIGFVGKNGMTRDLVKLRETLGETSDAWRSLKEEAFLRFMRKAAGAVHPTERTFSGANLSKAWETALEKNPEVMRTIFTNEERALISQFVRVAQRVTTSAPGGVNTSNTGGAVAQMVKKLFGSAVFGPKLAAFLEATPLLKGFTQLPDAVKAAGAASARVETSAIPVTTRSAAQYAPAATPLAAMTAGNRPTR